MEEYKEEIAKMIEKCIDIKIIIKIYTILIMNK